MPLRALFWRKVYEGGRNEVRRALRQVRRTARLDACVLPSVNACQALASAWKPVSERPTLKCLGGAVSGHREALSGKLGEYTGASVLVRPCMACRCTRSL